LTAQTPFDLGHEVVRNPQVIERLLEGLSSVLRLTAVTCEALLYLLAAPVSGFGMFFGASCGCGHRVLQWAVWAFGITCFQDFVLSFVTSLGYNCA
jgi:hypothetical protein